MKREFIFLSVFFYVFVYSQNMKLSISFSGMKNDKGNLMLAFFNSKDTFLKKENFGKVLKITNKRASISIDLPNGEYAFACFHDVNNNKKMDKNILGIPTERYAFSNNAKGFMSAPTYEKAKFFLDKDLKIDINLN